MDQVVIINRNDLKEELGDLKKEVLENIVEDIFARIHEIHPPGREVMTMGQLCQRWQVDKQSVVRWVRRESHPLPVHYVGGNPRFHLAEVDDWSKAEAARRLRKAENVTETVQ